MLMSIDNIYNRGLWLTGDVEIRTPNSWVPVNLIHKIESVLSYDEVTDSFIESKLIEFNINENYTGKIDKTPCVKGKNIHLVDSSWGTTALSKRKSKYAGKLYNLIVEHNNLIVRIKEKYTIVLCLVK